MKLRTGYQLAKDLERRTTVILNLSSWVWASLIDEGLLNEVLMQARVSHNFMRLANEHPIRAM